MVLESPFWLKYVPKSETFWSWVWNDISRFSSSYDSSVVLVLYSLYFDENLGDFRSNMFARIDNIMWWDGPFSTVLYLFFATGVAHSHKTDDEWPRKLSRPHPKDTQGRIPLNDKPYWEVSFFSLFFFFFSSFFLFLFLFFPLPPKGQNLPAPREIFPEKAISNANFELELTLRQLPFRDDEKVRSVPHPTKHSHAARADPRPPE